MSIHPRVALCRKYEAELRGVTMRVVERYADELTYAEIMKGISQVMHDHISQWIRSTIRIERHGDADTPGDRA